MKIEPCYKGELQLVQMWRKNKSITRQATLKPAAILAITDLTRLATTISQKNPTYKPNLFGEESHYSSAMLSVRFGISRFPVKNQCWLH